MADPEVTRNTMRFLDFVWEIRRHFPEQNCKYAVNGSLLSEPVASLWNKLGEDYLHVESVYALAATMYLLQEHGITEIAGHQTRWLSIGSGPGLYEFYLTKLLGPVKIDSLDISFRQLETGSKIATILGKEDGRYEKSVHRVRPVNASMENLPMETGSYDRVLLLNSLHWCVNWRDAIRETSRVLAPKKKARIYVVVASGSVVTTEGKRIITPDLNEDSFLDQFEESGLVAKSIVKITMMSGQYDQPTQRTFAVFGRESAPREHWGDRIISGKTEYGELTMFTDGTAKRVKFNS